MKNLRLYETEVDYTSDPITREYPTVSYCKENDVVYYLQKQASLFEFVDLGLPSGLKWATCNVGASKPEEFGLYFAWGETQGYTEPTAEKPFSWGDYTLCDGTSSNMLKYNATDGLTTLELSDDAAYLSDSTCRTPTNAEFDELRNNTTSEWTDVNGVYGCQFTSKVNENSIFVPAAGYCYNGSVYLVGQDNQLWSSSLSESDRTGAFFLRFKSGHMGVYVASRDAGRPVRPVKG